MKKLRTLPVYAVFVLICMLVIFPVLLAVVLPLRGSDELRATIDPLTGTDGSYSTFSLIAQYPTLENFKELLVFTPDFYKVFWNSILVVGSILLFQGFLLKLPGCLQLFAAAIPARYFVLPTAESSPAETETR